MKTNSQEHHEVSGSSEMLKWISVVILLVGAVLGNSYFESAGHWVVLRVLLVVVLIAIALLIAAITEKGKEGIRFAKASRMEMRKVVWPTKQETTQTSLIVIVALVIMSLLLWGIDGIFVHVVRWITGA